MQSPDSPRSRPKFRYRNAPDPKAPGWNLTIPAGARSLQSAGSAVENAIRSIGVRLPRRVPLRIKGRMKAPFTELVDFGAMLGDLGYVYFLHDASAKLVKIGFTRDIVRRAGTVRSASGRDAVLLGTIIGTFADENRIHRQFDRLRERGEWFRETPALMRDIAEILAAPQTPTVSIKREYRRAASLSVPPTDGAAR